MNNRPNLGPGSYEIGLKPESASIDKGKLKRGGQAHN